MKQTLTYNPVIKFGKFIVTDSVTGKSKKITCLDEITAKYNVAIKLGILPTIENRDFVKYRADMNVLYARLSVKCISETQRMYA